MTELDIERLKAAAMAATPIETDLYGDRYFQGSYSKADLTKAQDDFFTASSPAAVLELIAEVEHLRSMLGSAEPVAHLKFWAAQQWSGSGNHDIETAEGLCVCEPREIGDDKLPAFPVFIAPPAPVSAEPVLYRCFHCHEEFHDIESAGLHFGKSQVFDPACTIDIARFREMEQRMISYNEEDAEIHQQMAGLRNQHAIDLRREEEKGYARGLRDAVKYPDEVAPPATDAKDGEIEKVAQAIYEGWRSKNGYVEWVPNGNSLKQDEARQFARQAIAAKDRS